MEITLREAISKLSEKDRADLRESFLGGYGWCVPLGDKYIVGVHEMDGMDVIEKSEHGWFLAKA